MLWMENRGRVALWVWVQQGKPLKSPKMDITASSWEFRRRTGGISLDAKRWHCEMRSSSLPEENHQHIKRTEAFVCHYFPSTLTGVVKSVFVQSAQLSLRLCAFKVFFFYIYISYLQQTVELWAVLARKYSKNGWNIRKITIISSVANPWVSSWAYTQSPQPSSVGSISPALFFSPSDCLFLPS